MFFINNLNKKYIKIPKSVKILNVDFNYRRLL